MPSTPSFDKTEFNYIDPSLSVVQWWMTYDSIKKDLEAAIRERGEYQVGPLVRMDKVYKSILDRVAAIPNTGRKDRLRALAQKLTSAEGFPAGAVPGVQQMREEIALLYGQFDQEVFEADWKSITGSEDPNKKLKSLEGRIGGLMAKMAKHKTTVLAVFRDSRPPQFWGNYVLPDNATEDEVVEHGVVVACDFIAKWRARAVGFNVPVTVYGVDIATLGTANRKVWKAAYEALLFHRLPKNPIWHALSSGEREMEIHMNHIKGVMA